MDHKDIKELLSAFADNELTPAQHQMVEDHIAACAECRQIVSDLERLEELTAQHSPLGGDEAYWEDSASKIEQRLSVERANVTDITPRRVDSVAWYRWKWPAIAASVAIMIFIGINQTDILTDRDMDIMPEKPAALPVEPAAGDLPVDKVDKVDDEMFELKLEDADYLPKERSDEVKESDQTEEARRSSPRIGIPTPVPDRDDYKAKAIPAVPVILEAPSMDKTISVVGNQDMTASSESWVEELSADAEVESGDPQLAAWRRLVDSLTELQASPRGGTLNRKIDRLRQSTEQIISSSPAKTSALLEKLAGGDGSEIEAKLVDAWFRIGQNSPDTSEVRQAMQFLRSVAADTASANQKTARRHLRTLTPQ